MIVAGNGDKWRWADPQGVQRLVHSDELRAALASGALPPYTLVWRDGMKEWQPAYQVAELATVAISAQQGVIPNIPPPPLAIVAVQAEFERRVTTDAKESAAPKKEAEPPPPPIQQYAAIASAVPTHVMQTAGRPVVQPARVAAPVAAPPEPPKVAAPEPPKQVAQLPELPLPLPHGGRSVAPPPPPRRSRSPMAPAAPSMAPPAVHASSAPKKTLLGLSGPSSLVPPSDPVLASQNGGHVDAASMPSLPPHPSVRSAELNGSADDGPISDLPAFPLDEIDPDSVQTDGVFGSAPGGGASEEEARASADDDDPHLPLEKGIGSKIAETFREAEKSLRPFAVRAKEGLRPLAARAKVGTTKIGPAITRGARYIQENPKDPKVVAGLAGAAVLVLLMLVVIAASTGADAHDVAGAALPASSVASPLAASSERAAQPNVATTATVTTATAPTASAASSPPASCRLRREGIKIAAKASKDVPVEIVMTADGDRARIGFANDANAAQGLSVDLASLKFFPELAARAGGKVRAVVPLFSHGKPVFAVNAESKRDRLQ
ncbi:MAG TPA: DUF4339 domain-containing protein, partial [Polyangiaceae bacterium]|nr:DUF4339 domain-containing protein [Polyangiaceae bacterium]